MKTVDNTYVAIILRAEMNIPVAWAKGEAKWVTGLLGVFSHDYRFECPFKLPTHGLLQERQDHTLPKACFEEFSSGLYVFIISTTQIGEGA